MEPIAIVGLSFKMPRDAVDELSFWDVLERRRNLMTPWPESRADVDSFHDGSGKLNTLSGRGAHFIDEDPGLFDAPFFSITPKEAAAMDPQQRWVLETAYHAFENAGIPVESLRGSRTAVFGCSMSDDYSRMFSKDPDTAPRMSATGLAPSIMSNRVSWYFHLRGPSMQVETACSSSMIALDQACQSIRNGDATAALVFGSNALLSPESSLYLSNMGFLSPDSLCYSFDHRANGYARGEGVIAVVVKPLPHALRDGDVVRAVIRASGSNQDGKTATLTQPSAEAQEMLMRHVYQKAGLSFDDTRYIEAHGTGTPTGDPIEMKAIGRVFRTHRSPTSPLYVGSVKSNLGHLEGASGLAGIVKAVLALEKGVIPPNALFERMNPDIDADFYHVEVPTDKILWPTTGLRRASVNSFGFGGTNAHVVLDDALHYLRSRGLAGHHNCTIFSPNPGSPALNGTTYSTDDFIDHHDGEPDRGSCSTTPRLLVWTAMDSDAIDRVIRSYQPYFRDRVSGSPRKLDQLAYTLAARRTHMPWRCFSVVDAAGIIDDQLPVLKVKPVRASNEKLGIAFVFTGQGAQYVNMGLDLLPYPVFEDALKRADAVFARLGSSWSLLDALGDQQRINRPEYSQPLCTALQLALVELLKAFGISPVAVVGHSSGEIAAAYAIGALNFESACKVAFHRGHVAGKLKAASSTDPGAMMSVNLAESEVHAYLSGIEGLEPGSAHIACVNSPLNCTLSAPERTIHEIKKKLDADGIFAQKLTTGVAYHSPAMRTIAAEYLELLGSLEAETCHGRASMVSSVTGQVAAPKLLSDAKYWVENLVSPVRFSDALRNLVKGAALKLGAENITDIVEVGPHAALRRPVLDTLATGSKMRYYPVLQRSRPARASALTLLGSLFCHGHPVSVTAGNRHDAGTTPPPLVDCPKYPFDHSRRYWSEPRTSKDYRLRKAAVSHFLGKPSLDWNPLRPSFTNWLSVEAFPWLADHVISNTTISPGAGSVVMAIEAVKHLDAGRLPISGFMIKEAQFPQPIPVAEEAQSATEVSLRVRPLHRSNDKASTWFEVGIFASQNDHWSECFRADVQVQYETAETQVDGGRERRLEGERIANLDKQAIASCTSAIDAKAFYAFLRSHGLDYGPAFSLLRDVRWNRRDMSTAVVDASPSSHQTGDSPVHPAVLDAAVHLILAQVSEGMSGRMPTLVPQRLSNAWISARAWACSGASIRVTSVVKESTSLGVRGSLYALADDGSALCAIENMVMVPVSQNVAAEDEGDRNLLYAIEWKPQISALDEGELQDLCDAEMLGEVKNQPKDFERLDVAISKAATHALLAISDGDVATIPKRPDHVQKFAAMLEQRYGKGEYDPEEDIQALLEECETADPTWHLFTTMGRNLEAILRGEKDTLDILFGSNETSDFYASVFEDLCDARFRAFLDLASHQKPGLRIVEVGAGTGGMTRHVLSALRAFEKRTATCRFVEYVYTDVSPAFFEEARAEFAEYADRLVFRKYDLEKSPQEEGLEPGSFDLVIAGAVLHATADLTRTMGNVRSLLRTGGHVAFLEITAPDSAWANVGFGSLPGWWLATEDWRQQGPLVTEECWGQLARDNGFSGLDLCLRYDNCVKLMVATAIEERIKEKAPLVLLVGRGQAMQAKVAEKLSDKHNVQVVHIDGIGEATWADEAVVVSLLDLDVPFLETLDERGFHALQTLIRKTHNMLWVAGVADSSPHHGLAMGFLRTIRSEEPTKRIVTLSMESGKAGETLTAGDYAGHAEKVLESCFGEKPCPEVELAVRNGHLSIGRLMHEAKLEEDRRSRVKPALRSEAWTPGQALVLTVGTPGMLDTLCFSEDTTYDKTLEPDEVEMEAKAWPISFRDLFIALGRLSERDMGYECAGTVTRAGSATGFQPGERVCMFVLGSMRTHPRARASSVYRIPDSVSLEDAVAGINPGMTAYQALVNMARLQRGDKVLIHSATGSTGQMALWIAKQVGAEIFATVGYDAKRQLLMERFGIPADHIFYSRDTSFAQGIMRVTEGYGVDVVLNSLSGEGLRASWECIAAYGRFVEIGKMDIGSNAALPMGGFARNVSFCAVDLQHIVRSNEALAKSLIGSVMDMLSKGRAASPWPLKLYPAGRVEEAFRYMQSGRNIGRIILTAREGDVVPKFTVKRSSWTLDGTASYLVAGGLGGLGRAILQWMADRGAKNLIVPSRSGPSSPAASQLISKLESQGIRVLATKCDVGSADDLATLLAECERKGMPPIKGCVNSAMQLQDAVYEGMTQAQWQATIKSKVGSSWNLHAQLPADMDFFILLASLSGVYGSLAQSNYAAGCTYQDALARYRTTARRGGTSVSLDLGWMRDIGIVSEREDYRRNRNHARDMNPVDGADLLALLEHYCDPSTRVSAADGSQLLVGAVTPLDLALIRAKTPVAPAAFESLPLFAGFAAHKQKLRAGKESHVEDHRVLFRQAHGNKDKAAVVVGALAGRLARALGVAEEDVDPRKSLSEYGVDSLMAVELRNWIKRDFDAAVAVFDIMGGSTSIGAVGGLVAERARG